MATTEENAEKKEGTNLLGLPTFTELDNGRFKCVETGHEVLAKDKEIYSHSKGCRLGLIDFALSHKKPPLNMFKIDPLSRSKLVCKLTGDTVNKTEEHIWKHINGKRFLNKLEEKETGKVTGNGVVEEEGEKAAQKVSKRNKDGVEDKKKKKKKKKKKEKAVEEIISQAREPANEESDLEEEDEADFWMPPEGERWDFDDGGDRWGSDSESDQENDELEVDETDVVLEDGGKGSEELSTRTKRMSIEVGPSSFASRKKKPKKKVEC